MKRLLVGGVGNIFLGDDGFGVEVVRRLDRSALPEGVDVADFGIRAIDLGYALDDDYDAAILVDACARGGTPGSLYVIEPEPDGGEARPGAPLAAAHDLDPSAVLRMAQGGALGCVVIVGCEPASFGTEDNGDGRIGLSAPVAAAVEPALRLVGALLERLAIDAVQGCATSERPQGRASPARPPRGFKSPGKAGST